MGLMATIPRKTAVDSLVTTRVARTIYDPYSGRRIGIIYGEGLTYRMKIDGNSLWSCSFAQREEFIATGTFQLEAPAQVLHQDDAPNVETLSFDVPGSQKEVNN